MPVHETQGLGRHLGEGQGPFFLLRPGKSLSKAPSVFLNSETTKGTANKLGNAKAWGDAPDGNHCPPIVIIVFWMSEMWSLALGTRGWSNQDKAVESVC